MSAPMAVDVAGLSRPAGSLDISSALKPQSGRLDERAAAHLLRRAGFGASPDALRRYTGMPIGAAADALVNFSQAASLPEPDEQSLYDGSQTFTSIGGRRAFRSMDSDKRRELGAEIRKTSNRSMNHLRYWWLNRMLATPAPLQEKMALYFHGHFTSAGVAGIFPDQLYGQNKLFRQYALGNLRELTRKVSTDPAMLLYLNGVENVESHPNENYARELMELFTLGVGHYTESDVREAARAWTGWRYDRFTGRFWFDPSLHDDGSKTFLGRTGNFNGDDVVNAIFSQPQCARFFAASLLNFFVYNDPEPELVDATAALLRRHNFELAPVMSALLRSRVFFSERAYRALVKSPAEFVVGAHASLGLNEIEPAAVVAMADMGQSLFHPPNVAGWPGGKNWLNSDTMIVRQNYLNRLLNSQTAAQSAWLRTLPMQPEEAARRLIVGILQGDASSDAVARLHAYLGGVGSSALGELSSENFPQRVSGAAYLTMAMPAYQLN